MTLSYMSQGHKTFHYTWSAQDPRFYVRGVPLIRGPKQIQDQYIWSDDAPELPGLQRT